MSGRRAGTQAAKKDKGPAHLFERPKKSFGIGGDVPPKKNMNRVLKWPVYVRIQRQRKVLKQRLKVPPALNQFNHPLDRTEAKPVFKLLGKYLPETKTEKKARLEKLAAAGGAPTGEAPAVLKFGLNHVTYLVEQKKAELVVIAADVDPIELVVWLPALCRKMNVPYVIVNNKGRLGQLVYPGRASGKSVAVVALTRVNEADMATFNTIREMARAKFNTNIALRRKWGGGIVSKKTQDKLTKYAKAKAVEEAKKARF